MKISALFAAVLLLTGFLGGDRAVSPSRVSAPGLRPEPAPSQPGVRSAEIPLWPADLAIARPDLKGPESVRRGRGKIAGDPVTIIENVARPTMRIYPAKGTNSGTAVLVFPGGGYRALAIDLEGTEVCDWLTGRGVTCIVLKYRVSGSGHHWNDACKCAKLPKVPMALQDAQRAMVLLRQRAGELGIDKRRIGVLGFSAGGHLVTSISNAESLSYEPVDAADRQPTRPDFAIALYSGHLWSGRGVELYPFNRISRNAPPTFLVHAQDDPVDDVRHSIAYFLALRAVGIPVEMHIYAAGGHAFALRRTEAPITRWPDLAEIWLHAIGML